MSFMDNVRELTNYMKSRNIETRMDKQVIQENMKNSTIKDEYFSFVNSLLEDLDDKLGEGASLGAIEYGAKTPGDVKYFRIGLQDTKVTSLYDAEETPSGRFRFKPKTLETFVDGTHTKGESKTK